MWSLHCDVDVAIVELPGRELERLQLEANVKCHSIQIVHFHESNSGGVIHTTHDRGVVTWRQVGNDRGFPSVCWSMATVPDVTYLVGGNGASYDRMNPVIIRGNQSASTIMQFKRRIR